ncbi:hypothetical protein BU24DRAFT_202773 [Aaosphaeria arxii CBS 175.79]|uniref:Uncharacterized protein n=1 Tax=Aaosphaeria arxii CBS 175.79 TaxID=1450172 RepID=A0A6A5XTI2_9PLEO|nr:uncharacterized protein BU24DRAFT_202773 [Aaosphaeria arxii CBS 175.79]KAF2016492.1 hypothetical protein BU24DRAFT_202773 [Aaosphaeria arxii CBS 175.79]
MAETDQSAEAKAPTSQKKRKDLSKADNDDLDMIDSAFQRIKNIIPGAPYVLSTPSLDPYNHYSKHEARAWILGRLYRPDEEHLQYRTFHFREPYVDCFVLQPDEEEEAEHERPKSQASSTSQQAQQAPKKKISLSAYKSKQANGVITPGAKKVSPTLPPAKVPSQSNGFKKTEKPPSSTQKPEDSRSHKRPAAEGFPPEKPAKRPRDDLHQSSREATNRSSAEPRADLDKSVPSNSTPHGLPPLLSPVDQPVSNPYGLPDILSPTLPSNIQVELDRLETQRKRGDSNASSTSAKSQLLTVPDGGPERREEGSKGPRVRSVSVNSKSPNVPTATQSTRAASSLIVKLKYGKRHAATISQLLRLPRARKAPVTSEKERPSKTTATAAEPSSTKPKENPKITSRRLENTVSSAKSSPATGKVAGKRPRSELDPPSNEPSKRHKAQAVQDGSSTPQHATASPVVSAKSSAQKAPYITPRKEHRAVNLLRTGSNEGTDSTPGRSGTPTNAKHLDVKTTPTSAPPSGKGKVDFQILSQVSMKLNQMGRALKHEAQKIVSDAGGKLNKHDQKRVAITALECIISYMAAYTAQDRSNHLRGRAGDVEGTWKTLLPLCTSFTRFTHDVPYLDGLRLYLGTAIAASICSQMAPRAPRPEAHDSPQDIAQNELSKQHSVLSKNFALLADHFMKLNRYAQESRMLLPVEDIQKHFPKTWANRDSIANVSKDSEKFPGGKLSGPYFLPIQNDTTPIQAVRFGIKFLGEYCEKERVDYKLRVSLDRPEV